MARWVHRENVGSLPFPDDEAGRALAASVGATVAELNAEPVRRLDHLPNSPLSSRRTFPSGFAKSTLSL